ncbi:MAG: hypothetical protein HN849_34415 [Victivallales bacterium]|nr:hypothetical protein [Victivallales bacterium]
MGMRRALKSAAAPGRLMALSMKPVWDLRMMQGRAEENGLQVPDDALDHHRLGAEDARDWGGDDQCHRSFLLRKWWYRQPATDQRKLTG